MESIKRLRKWWRDKFPLMDKMLGEEFRWHLDEIEHEVEDNERFRREAEPFHDRLCRASERREDVTLWGVDYVPYPLDADGEPIHVGDVMEWDNGTFTVHELKVTEDGWTTWDEQHGYTVHVDVCHHRALTVEDVLREFADIVRKERVELATISEDTIAEFAAELRLAGDE